MFARDLVCQSSVGLAQGGMNLESSVIVWGVAERATASLAIEGPTPATGISYT
jgi:hypothetical protein